MKRSGPSKDTIDWDAKATEALEVARLMPPGPEKSEALKKAGMYGKVRVLDRHTRRAAAEWVPLLFA
jgi:hypothetical protein